MEYPTLQEAQTAAKGQLALWLRRLPIASNDEQFATINTIVTRFNDLGGWTPALSKAIGWGSRIDDKLRDEYDTGLDKTGPQYEDDEGN